MRFRRLGRSGLKLAPIGLGTDNFANPVDEATAHALLDRATAGGINLVDTSNSYGGQRFAGESLRLHALFGWASFLVVATLAWALLCGLWATTAWRTARVTARL